MPNDHDTQKESVTNRVLHRIESEHIIPRAKWEFILKNYVFWGLGALTILLGACAVSATIFEITHTEWQLAFLTHENFLSFFLDVAPFLWVVTLGLFILLGYVMIRRTKHGYRYPLVLIAVGAILMSLTLGVGLSTIGYGAFFEEASEQYVPFHPSITTKEQVWWGTPGRGLLGGTVISAAPDFSSFMLRDFTGNVWQIEGGDLRTPDITAVARGGVVRIVGLPVAATSSLFHACFVFPWAFGNMFNREILPPLTSIPSTTLGQAEVERSAPCESIEHYTELHTLNDAD